MTNTKVCLDFITSSFFENHKIVNQVIQGAKSIDFSPPKTEFLGMDNLAKIGALIFTDEKGPLPLLISPSEFLSYGR